jgi:hypothetical protein
LRAESVEYIFVGTREIKIEILGKTPRKIPNAVRSKFSPERAECLAWNWIHAGMKSDRNLHKHLYVLLTILSFAWTLPAAAAGQVVFLKGVGEETVEQEQLELATRFYGLGLESIAVQSNSAVLSTLDQLRKSETLAVVAEASVMQGVQSNQIFSALRRPQNRDVPLLIVDITHNINSATLQQWSDGAVSACHSMPFDGANAAYLVGTDEVARQLAGIRLPAVLPAACAFALDSSRATTLLSEEGSRGLDPVFIRTETNRNQVFFLADMKPSPHPAKPPKMGLGEVFSRIAPFMMFVRFAAGDHGWHSPGHYANLTVDDAWLTEPYGYLNYETLSAEMEKHNFHTTIAFIPWNFDRSDPRLVSFIRSHSDRFSIAVHGNNHDHAEFGAYDRKPLAEQVANLQQALARMNGFQDLTGLPFDSVMTFPYGVVPPLQTVRKLKEYGFAAATNDGTVPLGSAEPSHPLFFLRPMTSDFATFALVLRYRAEQRDPKSMIAIHAFLDDPLLFYCHQDFFTSGIGAFNPIADTVNQLQPDTRWGGLGLAAQHLYLVKRQDDTHYDVLDFSTDFVLDNKLQRDVTFDVEKAEDGLTPIQGVTVNGQPSSFEVSAGYLRMGVLVPGGSSRRVVVRYQNDLDLATVDVSKKNLRFAILRHASDFRDITMSKYRVGRAITEFYYNHHMNEVESALERPLSLLILFFVPSVAFLWFRKRAKTKKSSPSRLPRRRKNPQSAV